MNAFADGVRRSLAVSTSTIRKWTVSAAVKTERADELAVLDSLTAHGRAIDFRPFRDTVDDLDLWTEAHRTFCRRVLAEHGELLTAVSHRWSAGQRPEHHRAQTMHPAVLSDVNLDGRANELILVGGDRRKARVVAAHAETLGLESPNVLNCTRGQTYYPTILLANVAAKYLAWSLNRDRYDDARSVLRAPRMNETRELRELYASVHRGDDDLEPNDPEWFVNAPNCLGSTPGERLRCWFGGYACWDVDASEQVPEEPSADAVRSHLISNEYARLVGELPLDE